MKLWVSYLLIILFSLQQLPVKELGKLLVKKSTTEQVQDSDEANNEDTPAPKQFKEDPLKYCLHPVSFHLKEIIITHRVETALHEAHQFIPHFVPDIVTPPPNLSC